MLDCAQRQLTTSATLAPTEGLVAADGTSPSAELYKAPLAAVCGIPLATCCILGSSDPHGLQLNDDRAPLPRRKPTYNVGRHLEADDACLRRRPLPQFNIATATDAKPPPPAQLSGAPVVTCISQVVPKRTLAIVRTWLRRLRRSLRAAASGKFSLAKRLRPDDLWLPHAEHSIPATSPWRWDLSPLSRGEPAVPHAVSGRGGVAPFTDLVLSEFAQGANTGFDDQAILSEVRTGVEDDAVCPPGSLLCAPHGSALEKFAVANEKLTANVKLGWASANGELPCWPVRAFPVGIVDESERAGRPKFRITSDLSWPPDGLVPDGNGSFVRSLNSSMAREAWPANRLPKASDIAEAAAILQSSGVPVKAWGFDCKAYYRNHGRQLSELWKNVVAWSDGFFVDERCCFGSAADAVKCARISNFIAWRLRKALAAVDAAHPPRLASVLEWQAERRAAACKLGVTATEAAERFTALFSLGIYIDDAAASSVDDPIYDADGSPHMREGVHVHRAQLHWEAALSELSRLGYKSEESKEQPPSESLEVLGVKFDLSTNRMCMLPRKREAYAKRAREMAARRTCSKRELLALLGRLTFAAGCFPHGRSWLDAAWRVVRANFRLHGDNVLLSHAACDGFASWAAELDAPEHDGVPLAPRMMRAFGDTHVGAIYADASDDGYAAWTVHEHELLYIVDEWPPELSAVPIHGKELQASTLGLIAFAPECGMRDVYSFTDNVVAQYAMRSGTSNSQPMQRMLNRRSEWLTEHSVLEAAERITSKANLWADLGSRGKMAEVIRQAAALGIVKSRCITPPSLWVSGFEADWLTPCDDAADAVALVARVVNVGS